MIRLCAFVNIHINLATSLTNSRRLKDLGRDSGLQGLVIGVKINKLLDLYRKEIKRTRYVRRFEEAQKDKKVIQAILTKTPQKLYSVNPIAFDIKYFSEKYEKYRSTVFMRKPLLIFHYLVGHFLRFNKQHYDNQKAL